VDYYIHCEAHTKNTKRAVALPEGSKIERGLSIMKKEFIKVLAATAICMGIFTTAFLGVNSLALSASTTTLQSANTVVHSPAPTPAQQAEVPEIALNVRFESDAVPNEFAMSPEDAAYIGAQYILDMFDKDIDGKVVHMMYRSHPSMTRTFWSGIVTPQTDVCPSDEEGFANLLRNYAMFEFSIDAITGKRIDIMRTARPEPMADEVRAALDEAWRRSGDRGATEEMINLRSGGPPPANMNDYKQAAKDIAQRHFINSEIVDVEFRNANATGFALDQNGNITATGRQLMFVVTDDTGRTADIAIDEITKQLRWIFTAQNDIIPGFNHRNGPGRG